MCVLILCVCLSGRYLCVFGTPYVFVLILCFFFDITCVFSNSVCVFIFCVSLSASAQWILYANTHIKTHFHTHKHTHHIYRVVKTHRMPYLYRLFPAKTPYN